jgi:hypothetical protein
MLRIHVLDREGVRWFRGVPPFWYAVHLNRRYLREMRLRFGFFSAISDSLCDCDILFLSSRYFHLEGQSPSGKQKVLETLSALNSKARKIIWFDLRDSSGNTQFEVIPYVSKYLKKQLLRDRGKYREPFYGNRVYTDYFHKQFGIEDSYVEESIPLPPGSERKLGISWNIGLHDNRGGGLLRKLTYVLSDQLEALGGTEHRIAWRSCSAKREVHLVALFHQHYERNTVAFQRQRASQILAELRETGVITGEKLPRTRYLQLVGNAKMVLSLFGWGEICFRDFEAFMAGAALLRPDVSHLETWPDVYTAHETYWPVEWDLSDLVASYHHLLSHETLRLGLAQTGQARYRRLWTREGRECFCERLGEIVGSALSEP